MTPRDLAANFNLIFSTQTMFSEPEIQGFADHIFSNRRIARAMSSVVGVDQLHEAVPQAVLDCLALTWKAKEASSRAYALVPKLNLQSDWTDGLPAMAAQTLGLDEDQQIKRIVGLLKRTP